MSGRDSIALIRDLFLILAVLLFFTGWLFSFYYLQNFGIPMHVLDAPIYSYYFYALNVVLYVIKTYAFGIWTALLIASVAILLLRILYPTLRSPWRRSLVPLILLVFSVWFIGGYHITHAAATAAADRIRSGQAPVIKFEFKEGGSLAAARVVDSAKCPAGEAEHVNRICRGNLEERFFLVLETKTHFLVYFKPAAPPILVDFLGRAAQPPRVFVYRIPMDDVATAVIVTGAAERSVDAGTVGY